MSLKNSNFLLMVILGSILIGANSCAVYYVPPQPRKVVIIKETKHHHHGHGNGHHKGKGKGHHHH